MVIEELTEAEARDVLVDEEADDALDDVRMESGLYFLDDLLLDWLGCCG